MAVAWSIFRAQRGRRPAPQGSGSVDHSALVPILGNLASGGVPALANSRLALAAYRDQLAAVDPDTLTADAALAYWLNLYNAGALDLAAETFHDQAASVLRLPGGFSRPWVAVDGESLSLDDIEHGKIRRFRDPRIHAALVCGSASCPTLRLEPYDDAVIDEQLDAQLRSFLATGGAIADHSDGVLRLSRVFRWYGGDFIRPQRMPTWLPAGKKRLVAVLAPWFSPEVSSWVRDASPGVDFQPYDWSLACAVR